MTTLNRGVDTFASSAWADGTGFATDAELTVGVHFSRIVAGLVQSGVAIESLDFLSSAKGVVGGGDFGPLKVDVTSSANARVTNRGQVTLPIEAVSKINNIHTGNIRAITQILGGEAEVASITQGRQTLSSSATCDEYLAAGGRSVIEYNSTALTLLECVGGVSWLKRKGNKIIVGKDATLHLMPEPSESISWTGAEIEIHGGTVLWYGGAIPSIRATAGTIDFRPARESISGLGSTKFEVGGATIIPNDEFVDLSNLTAIGAIFNAGDAGFEQSVGPGQAV